MSHNAAAPGVSRPFVASAVTIELLLKLAIFVGPTLYALGRVSNEAFWEALGISPSLLAMDTGSYIYNGFSVVVSAAVLLLPSARGGAIWLAPFASLLLVAVLATSIYLIRRLRAWASQYATKIARSIRGTLRKNKEASSSVLRASEILSAVANLALATLIGLLALLLPLVGAHSVGTKRANQLMKKVNSGEPSRQIVGIVDHPDQMFTLIDCNEGFCVVMKEGKARALPIQHIRW